MWLALAVACRAPADPPALAAGATRLVVDDGRVSIVREDGHVVLDDATAWVSLGTLDGPVADTRAGDVSVAQDGDALAITSVSEAATLVWTIRATDDAYTFVLDVRAGGEVARMVPLDGHLALGDDPSRVRVLENGSWGLFDHVVDLVPGDVRRDDAWGVLAPGALIGNSVSNWNHAAVDLDGGGAWVAGATTFDRSLPGMGLATDGDGLRVVAQSSYLPLPVPIGDGFRSETFWVAAAPADPLQGLEDYGDAVAAELGITTWTARGNDVPNGWNSWSASSSTGGYGTAIDEAIVRANLDVMATELAPFGFDWFQIDDGWQMARGDWTWNLEKFPSGPEGLVAAVRARGLRPGLWIAPMVSDPDAALAVEHPDWLATKGFAAKIAAGNAELLDTTNPDAREWLRGLGATVRGWDFDWVKMDFAYLALLGEDLDDPTATRESGYRGAVGALRDGLGDELFLLAVAVMGTHYGLVDADRVTLDNLPVWDFDPKLSADDLLNQQGFKPTVRTAARRYWMNDRIWALHPDLILFRSNTENASWPRVTFEESRAFASYVGLSGGIVKLGDRLVDLRPEELDVVRRLVPIDPRGARPVDLFEHEFPEVWHVHHGRGLEGNTWGSWDLVGLFDWGTNTDLTVSPYAPIPDGPRPHGVDLARLGLDPDRDYLAWEFWTERSLGVVRGRLDVDVPPHDARVIALRERTGVPQFLGWNRQISMGGRLLETADWDAGRRFLWLGFPVVPGTAGAPFRWHVAVYVPDGYAVAGVWDSGPVENLTWSVDGEVLDVTFDAAEVGDAHLIVRF